MAFAFTSDAILKHFSDFSIGRKIIITSFFIFFLQGTLSFTFEAIGNELNMALRS